MIYFYFKNGLANTLDEVNNHHVSIMITRQSGKSVVVLSLEDFNSYQETAYLMSSVNNVKRLDSAIKQLENRKSKSRKLIKQ